MRIPSGKTDQYLYFVALDATDHVTRETGLSSFTVVRSRNGAADVTYTTPTVVEIDATTMPGLYALLVDEDTTIASGSDSEEYSVHITCSGMAPVTRTVELYRPNAGFDIAIPASPTAHSMNERIQQMDNAMLLVEGTVSAAAVNSITLPTNDKYGVAIPYRTTAQAWRDYQLVITEGTGRGQQRVIYDHSSAGVLLVSPNWTTTPDTASKFAIMGPQKVSLNNRQPYAADGGGGGTTAAALNAAETATFTLADGGITAAKFAAGAIDANAIATDAITAAKIAANAITSSEIADGAITAAKIADDAITAAKIANNAIGNTEIADGAISAAKFASGAITSTVIATDAIGAAEIAADAIAEIKAAVAEALQDIHLDHLLAVDTGASLPGAAGALFKDIFEDDGGTWRYTANALEMAPSGGGGGASAAAIADAICDESLAGHDGANTVGRALKDILCWYRNKINLNNQTHVRTIYEDDGTTPRTTRTESQPDNINTVIQ